MTSLHLVIYSYVFVILLFYLFIYLFIFFKLLFFHLGREPEGIIWPHISGVSSNQPLPCIHLDEVRYPALSWSEKEVWEKGKSHVRNTAHSSLTSGMREVINFG